MGSNALDILTPTSYYSLGSVLVLLFVAFAASKALLPTRASKTDTVTFIWLAFDALIHFFFEGSFLYLSLFGRTVNSSVGPFASLWQEYAKADFRWGTADETVVSLELLTVFGAGPLCCYILFQLVKGDPARHYWLVVLSTAEIYGGWMTFCPEWLTGSPNLVTDNPIYLWLYLVFFNILWVFIPLWLLWDSYHYIATSLRSVQSTLTKKKRT